MAEIVKKLGATFNSETGAVDFRLHSIGADSVVLEIFENSYDEEPLATFPLKKAEGNVWETSIKKYALFNLHKSFYYAYRVYGKGRFFDENKLAYDPWAHALSYDKTKKNYQIKSEFFLYEPKIVTPVASRPIANEVIGEVHIKDLTIKSGFDYAGTCHAASKYAKKLQELGLTMVEFLPLNDFDDSSNYWGYMPLSYFALLKKYFKAETSPEMLSEFQDMINEFHKCGIKVCMDMVYNHSANNASYRLIDGENYYKFDKLGNFLNHSGCGNDIKMTNPAVWSLVADSLAYFARLGVDAFRFDLGLALMDISDVGEARYDNKNSLFAHLPELLEKRGIKVSDGKTDGILIITEPWTCGGSGCYALGKFPDFVYEWNDIARNVIRSSTIRPNEVNPEALYNLTEGSKQIYGEHSRSINYIASHDGLTLRDLNTYYQDGWEICGDHFGDTMSQMRSIKKQILLLALATGTPMLQIGDLIGHTKGGKADSYQDDSDVNYLDFSAVEKSSALKEIYDFWQIALNFRREFKPQNWARKYYSASFEQVLDFKEYQKQFLGYIANSGENKFYVAISGSSEELYFALPHTENGASWKKVISNLNNAVDDWDICRLKPYEIAIFKES